jgi:hypothetical protein
MTTAAELQFKYGKLALEWLPVLEAKVSPHNPNTSDEERAVILMEIIYRTFGARRGYEALCWSVVYGDAVPFPEGLQAPSQFARIDSEHRQKVIEGRWSSPGTVLGMH